MPFNRSRSYLLYTPSKHPRERMNGKRIDRDLSPIGVGAYRIRPMTILG